MPLSSQNLHAIHRRPEIGDLATELLTETFRLSAESSHPFTTSLDFSPNKWLPKFHKMLGKISLVCRKWRDIIVATPMFWTTFVGYVDAHPLPESYIPLFVARSKNLPLSVYISRKDSISPALNLGEREVVLGFLSTFPESVFDRVSTLSIHSYERSSLPEPSIFFSNAGRTFKQLHTLIFHSNIDGAARLDNPSNLTATQHLRTHTFFAIPSLRILSINGRDLLHLLDGVSDLRTSLGNLETLAVSHLRLRTRPYSTQRQVDALFELASSLPHLSTLAFNNFKVKGAYQSPRTKQPPAATPSIRQVIMYNMESNAIMHVLKRVAKSEEVVLAGCTFTQPLRLVADSCMCTKIFFDGHSIAEASVELYRSDFDMISCPSFDDSSLFSTLTSLFNVDCGSFSRAIHIAHVVRPSEAPPYPLHRRYYLADQDAPEATTHGLDGAVE